MIKNIGLLMLSCVNFSANAQREDYLIQPIPFNSVKLTNQFWTSRIETNRTATIPASFARCESTGRVKNFEMAADHKGKFCTVYPFDDTSVYKTIEGASYSLAVHPDPKLSNYIDSLISIVGKAQEADGYLYTARSIGPVHPQAWAGPERWVNESKMSHELYNCGHMFEAAAAHYMATGKRNFLNIALKNADLLITTFGPDKRHVPWSRNCGDGLGKIISYHGKKGLPGFSQFFHRSTRDKSIQ